MTDLKPTLALVGPAQGVNYGNALTYFSLYQALKNMGYNPYLVLPPLNFWWGKWDGWSNWRTRPYEESCILPRFETKREIARYFEQHGWCDIYLVGSDQLYRFPHFCDGLERYAYLDWVPNEKKKCVYAASFGADRLIYNKKDWIEMRYWLRKFDAFSVREKSAVSLCHDYFRIKATWVPDPVFLCDRRQYERLADESAIQHHGVVSYILDIDEEKEKIESHVCENSGGNLFKIRDYPLMGDKCSVEDWINLIRHAHCLVTDSFHGACFAIIFHVPFILIPTAWKGNSRNDSLLEITGLHDRLVVSYEDYLARSFQEIDWVKVDTRLAEMRTKAYAYLKEALTPGKRPKHPIHVRIGHYIHYLIEKMLRPSKPGRCSKLRKTLMNLIPLSSLRRRLREKYLKPKSL